MTKTGTSKRRRQSLSGGRFPANVTRSKKTRKAGQQAGLPFFCGPLFAGLTPQAEVVRGSGRRPPRGNRPRITVSQASSRGEARPQRPKQGDLPPNGASMAGIHRGPVPRSAPRLTWVSWRTRAETFGCDIPDQRPLRSTKSQFPRPTSTQPTRGGPLTHHVLHRTGLVTLGGRTLQSEKAGQKNGAARHAS